MALFQNIKDYFTNRRLSRLEGDLKILNAKRIGFNPFLVSMLENENESGYSRRIAEYRTWATGNSWLLREFYFTNYKTIENVYNTRNYFWSKAPINYRMLHYPVASLISSKMPFILFGGGVFTEVKIFDENGEESTEKTSRATELLKELLSHPKVKWKEKLDEASVSESWAGHVFLKLSHDLTISPLPIIEVVDITKAEIIKERGITKHIIFKEYYTVGEKRYRLEEIYGTTESGESCIDYRLFKIGEKEIRVALDSIPQTAYLKDQTDEYGRLILKGLTGLLAFEKPNKIPSLEFPNLPYGKSDYEGAIDSFDAVDEAYSSILNEIRDNRTYRYYDSTMLRVDEEGNPLPPDGFTANFLLNKSGDVDQLQGAKNERRVDYIEDKTSAHKEKFLVALTSAINNAGLSPYAIGLTGLESINSSAESQQERNKVTLETRQNKHELWRPFLQNFFKQFLLYAFWLQNTQSAQIESIKNVNFNANDKMLISVSFGDYVNDTDKQLVDVWSTAKIGGVSSIKTAVKSIHKQWTEDEIDEEVNIIRYENGMASDDPSTLPELTGTEDIIPDNNQE